MTQKAPTEQPPGESEPTPVLATLAAIAELFDQLPADLGAELCDVLGSGAFGMSLQISDRAQTVLAQFAAHAQVEGMWALDGSGTCAGYLTRNYPISAGRARTLCTTGTTLRDHLPTTTAALRAGQLGWDYGLDMAKQTTTSEPRRQALDDVVESDVGGPASADDAAAAEAAAPDSAADDADTDAEADGKAQEPQLIRGEQWLTNQAATMSEYQFRALLKYWAATVDPEADERGYRDVEAAEFLQLAPTLDCYHLEGKLTTEHGQLLATALDRIIGVPSSGDSRTSFQRRAHALADMARLSLEQNFDSTTSATRPHLNLAISWQTFAAMAANVGIPEEQLAAMATGGPATWADGTGPLPHSLTAALACDSDITRMIFGPGGQLINLGRTERIVPPGLRRAIITRDRHCAYPRCDAPPALCQVHHVRPWLDGGATDVDNLLLLCWRHHRYLHGNGITVAVAFGRSSAAPGAPKTPPVHDPPTHTFWDRNHRKIE